MTLPGFSEEDYVNQLVEEGAKGKDEVGELGAANELRTKAWASGSEDGG